MITRKWETRNGTAVYLVNEILFFFDELSNPKLEVGIDVDINKMMSYRPYKSLEQYNRYLIQELDEEAMK